MKILTLDMKTMLRLSYAKALAALFYMIGAAGIATASLALCSLTITIINRNQCIVLTAVVFVALCHYILQRANWSQLLKQACGLESIPLDATAKFELGGLLLWKSRFEHRCSAPVPSAGLLAALQACVLALLGYGAAWGTLGIWDMHLDQARQELKHRGFATSVAEFQSRDNNVKNDLYQQLSQLEFKNAPKTKYTHPTPPIFELWDAKTLAYAQDISAENSVVLNDVIIPAIRKGVFQDPFDYQAMVAAPATYQWPSYKNLILSAHTLAFTAVVAARQGDTTRAWECVNLTLDLGKFLASSPMLLSRSAAAMIFSAAGGAALNILAVEPSRQIPVAAKNNISAAMQLRFTAVGLKGEIAREQDIIEFEKRRYSNPLTRIYLDITAINNLKLAGFAESLEGDYESADAVFQKIARQTRGHAWITPFWVPLPRYLSDYWEIFSTLPNYGAHYAAWELTIRTRMQLILLFNALNLYKKDHGAYPSGLDMLTATTNGPELLYSIFDGKPISYAATKNGQAFSLSVAAPKTAGQNLTIAYPQN